MSKTKQVTLYPEAICVAFLRDKNMDHLSVAHHEEYVESFQQAMHTITMKILTSDPEVTTVEYPANWWEAFKERWFPWCEYHKKKVVVRYTTKYPELNTTSLISMEKKLYAVYSKDTN